MKKTIQFGMLLMFAFLSISAALSAQNIQDEALALTQKYQTAYNKKDDKALKEMYTKDAIRTINDSIINKGNEAIRAAVAANDFKAQEIQTAIKQDKAKLTNDGTLFANGTFHIWGKTLSGEAFDLHGKYANTLIKVNGEWKISKSDITVK